MCCSQNRAAGLKAFIAPPPNQVTSAVGGERALVDRKDMKGVGLGLWRKTILKAITVTVNIDKQGRRLVLLGRKKH